MSAKQGNLSINSENMLPIIKKWLYSDHDIFVREQISNACDAITKLKKLEGIGEYHPAEDHTYEISVEFDPEEKTLTFIDTGIGMTAEEVEEYITQIAFSGATKFIEQYQGKEDAEQIIGHFGLGFYSAFMVADEVHIDTLSYKEGAKSVHWESDGQSTYTIDEGSKNTIGTEITLFLNDNCYEFCNEYRLKEVIGKYCSFMPYPIFLTDVSEGGQKKRQDEIKKIEEENAKALKEAQDKGEEAPEPKAIPVPEPVNDTNPLWMRKPSDCTDEDYKEFYRKVFHDYKEPLFWLHLNTDYPFNLRGILYFPKINYEYETAEGEIKLYNNQVFIADNIKEVVPEFLTPLKGVIDCPDMPLNVSRSALQNDGTVKKIAEYITRKTADKLTGMCKTKREDFEKCFEDISPYLKYGCIRDEKFAKKILECMLYHDLDGDWLTLKEYREKNGIPEKTEEEKKAEEAKTSEEETADENAENKEPEKNTIFYVTDEVHQATYVNMFKNRGKDAVVLHHNIDTPFIGLLERQYEDLKFARIDSEINDSMKSDEEVSEEDKKTLTDIFKKNLENDKLNVDVVKMVDDSVASVMTLSEESRRLQDMMRSYGMDNMDGSMYGIQENLTLNANHPLVKFVLEHKRAQAVPVICKQLYDLAAIAHKPLNAEEMEAFIKRSTEIMMLLTK